MSEFKRLKGKMDASDPQATTVDAYMAATAPWRTDLYAGSGTLLTHAESIALLQRLGVKFTPELKAASVAMPSSLSPSTRTSKLPPPGSSTQPPNTTMRPRRESKPIA